MPQLKKLVAKSQPRQGQGMCFAAHACGRGAQAWRGRQNFILIYICPICSRKETWALVNMLEQGDISGALSLARSQLAPIAEKEPSLQPLLKVALLLSLFPCPCAAGHCVEESALKARVLMCHQLRARSHGPLAGLPVAVLLRASDCLCAMTWAFHLVILHDCNLDVLILYWSSKTVIWMCCPCVGCCPWRVIT
eukprot:scaffold127002_cov18-Tisochrysis_lutea.AAC.1